MIEWTLIVWGILVSMSITIIALYLLAVIVVGILTRTK